MRGWFTRAVGPPHAGSVTAGISPAVLSVAMGLSLLPAGMGFGATNEDLSVVTPISRPQSIGIEGRAVVSLPAGDYQVKPLDDRTELILRIEQVERGPARNRYHLHFIGLEPGAYSLADYLIRPDGSRPEEIGETRLQVRATLPEEHDGRLNSFVARPFPFIGGYRAALAGLTVLWIVGLAGFALVGRKRIARAETVSVPQPTFAERLRPLVEAAIRGQLSVDEQAALERLLMGYWRDRLRLDEARMADMLQHLKAHAEAGAILRAVERWLHKPGAAPGSSEINTLLEPYRTGQPTLAWSEGRRS